MHQNLTETPSAKEFDRPDLYINRELSWVEFNRRVFGEAQDSRHPLLERVKFLSIFDSNLDEYIMIRLAGLKDQLAAHVISLSPDGLTAEEQLAVVRELLAPLIQEVHYYWLKDLIPLLAEKHIRYGGFGGIAYHHVSDMYILLFSHFIGCGVFEAIYLLDGLIRNRSDIKPSVIHADIR